MKKKLFITEFNLIQWLFNPGTEHVKWNQNIPLEIYLENLERIKIWNKMKIIPFFELVWNVLAILDETEWN